MHGGTSPGAKKGNSYAKKHGVYSRFFTEEELAELDEVSVDDINGELKLCKIQLLRALKADQEQAEKTGGESLELISQTIQAVKSYGEDARKQVNQSFQKTNFSGIINTLIGRIQSLTHSRQDLIARKIDIELKQIELEKIKSAETENEAQPVKVVIQMEDARKYDSSEAE